MTIEYQKSPPSKTTRGEGGEEEMVKLSVSTHWPAIEIKTVIYNALLKLGYTEKKIFFMHPGERNRVVDHKIRAGEKENYE